MHESQFNSTPMHARNTSRWLLGLIGLCCALLGGACTDSNGLSTPRTISFDSQPLVSPENVTFAFEFDGRAQNLDIVPNRFQCQVNTSSIPPTVRLNVELQNFRLVEGELALNSIYLRAESLGADNQYVNLSNDPSNVAAAAASQILIHQPDGSLFEYRQPEDRTESSALRIRLRQGPAPGQLIGELSIEQFEQEINGRFPSNANGEALTGSIAINYAPN